ncbi:type II toxin-antitoxin system HicA family toxin [Campylobacter ureolyticus]|uniref:type II toxin-antitoxin system HicA family toxin n=1 Tax=Campylobacter ureolyticus TaxID=827 RepID=UPI0022B5BE7C|nr:type II toxin-antitoxin system HicA family toxin [Campylobacter ureolyticus]MCZ6156470.1 type II toxin-antitoxin system HicA family toxin [Campylobacter ureolyticus]
MSKEEKLIKELENNPKNVRFEILEKLLISNGFRLRCIKGSHHQFTNNKILITLPYNKPMKRYYVKLVLDAIKDKK